MLLEVTGRSVADKPSKEYRAAIRFLQKCGVGRTGFARDKRASQALYLCERLAISPWLQVFRVPVSQFRHAVGSRSRNRLLQDRADRVGHRPIAVNRAVRVKARHEIDTTMSEAIRDQLDRYTLLGRQGGHGVPELVRREFRHAGGPACAQQPLQGRMVGEGLTVAAIKHQASVEPMRPALLATRGHGAPGPRSRRWVQGRALPSRGSR